MIKVLAIDDEPLALQQLAAYIKKVPFLELMGECQSATEAKEILNHETIDAIFCDINMPDLNGMDFVKSLAAPPLVVFTTAYSEYAVEGFKVNAVDYLLKPFGLDDFRRAANRLQERLATPAAPESVPEMHAQPDEDDTIFVKTDYKVVLPSYFMRIHRSYIINLKMIQEVNKNRVIMDADTYLPIGDNYKDAFNDYLNTKFLGK